MAAFIDSTYFYGTLHIPQLTLPANTVSLTWFIDEFEAEYLKRILGVTLYDAMIAAPAEARMIALKGKFLMQHGSAKISPIANYVYFRYMNQKVTSSTGGGEKKVKGENSTEESPRYKLAAAWNRMRELNLTIRDWLRLNTVEYPEYSEPRQRMMYFSMYSTYQVDVKTFRNWEEMFSPLNPFL